MSEIKRKQIKIYDNYGLMHQLDKLEEEALELALALKRYIGMPKEVRYSNQVTEEMADVLNLIEQILFANECVNRDVQALKEKKIDREIERIKRAQI